MNPLRFLKPLFAPLILFLVVSRLSHGAESPSHGAVATVHSIATDAASAAMKRGGNAIDGSATQYTKLRGVVPLHRLIVRSPRC